MPGGVRWGHVEIGGARSGQVGARPSSDYNSHVVGDPPGLLSDTSH